MFASTPDIDFALETLGVNITQQNWGTLKPDEAEIVAEALSTLVIASELNSARQKYAELIFHFKENSLAFIKAIADLASYNYLDLSFEHALIELATIQNANQSNIFAFANLVVILRQNNFSVEQVHEKVISHSAWCFNMLSGLNNLKREDILTLQNIDMVMENYGYRIGECLAKLHKAGKLEKYRDTIKKSPHCCDGLIGGLAQLNKANVADEEIIDRLIAYFPDQPEVKRNDAWFSSLSDDARTTAFKKNYTDMQNCKKIAEEYIASKREGRAYNPPLLFSQNIHTTFSTAKGNTTKGNNPVQSVPHHSEELVWQYVHMV